MANAAPIIFTNASFFYTTSTASLAVSGSDLGTRLREIAFTISADEHDVTAMQSNGWRARAVGLKSAEFALTAYQDFESSSSGTAIDKKFFDLLDTGALFNVELRPFNAARSSDNPGYQASVRNFSHNPMNGSVGEVLMTPLRLLSGSAVVRAVSSS